MNFTIARTRYEYDSYQDLHKLVDLSGFNQCFIDQIKLDVDTTYVFSPINGEVEPHLRNERKRVGTPMARVVWWMLERPDDSDSIEKFKNDVMKKVREGLVDEVWVSDRAIANIIGAQCRFVPMGSHPGLVERVGGDDGARFDVIYLAAPTGRRTDTYGRIANLGISAAQNAWHELRTRLLNASRLMVNVHKDRWGFTEPLRFAVAAAHSIPVLTETCISLEPFEEGVDMVSDSFHQIPDKTKKMLEDSEALREIGRAFHSKMCVEYPFGMRVVDALKEMQG